MPKNTTILMIRHAEKPDDDNDPGLAVAGQERAQAYVVYFQNYPPGGKPIKLNYLFASEDSKESHRPKLTLKPLAQALNLQTNLDYKDKDYGNLATEINGNSKYDQSQILICWHHGHILDLAGVGALGVDPSKLPASSNWPPNPWPGEVFGWLLQISYDANGNVIPAQTMCINQKLMYDDHGLNPPAVMVKLKPSTSNQTGDQQ